MIEQQITELASLVERMAAGLGVLAEAATINYQIKSELLKEFDDIKRSAHWIPD